MLNIDKYRSVTWRMGGRLYPILDCYGLVHEVRNDLGLPPWPDFAGVVTDGGGMDRATKSFRENVTQCEPCAGAVAACYSAGAVIHLAIVVSIDGGLHVIESQKGTNVSVFPLRRFERRYMNKVEYYK